MDAHAIPYGRQSLRVEVDGRTIEHRAADPIVDETAAVCRALSSPIGTPPLAHIVKPGERVVLIVNDITRLTRTDLLLPPVIEVLNRAGIDDSAISIVFALGIHRPQTDEERACILGNELFHRIRNFDHICTDEADLVTVGTTTRGNTVQVNRHVLEADRIILTGEIMYHLIAGYSGGRKSLVPGVAGWRTTTFNHSMIFQPNCASGILDGNPAHEDLLDACRLVEPDFLVNVILTPDGKLAGVVAGHYELAHRAGCRIVDEVLSAEVNEPCDLLIASAGGFPLDVDLRQAHKGLENACRALKPGGSIMFFAECSGGSGHPLFDQYVERFRDHEEMKRHLLQHFEVGGHKAYWVVRLGEMYDVHLVSELPDAFVERCHLKPVASASYAGRLRELVHRTGPDARIGIIPHAGHTLPRVQAS